MPAPVKGRAKAQWQRRRRQRQRHKIRFWLLAPSSGLKAGSQEVEAIYGKTSSSRRARGARKKGQEEDIQEEGAQACLARNCAHPGFVQQHDCDDRRSGRKRTLVEEQRFAWIPGITQRNAIRSSAGRLER